MQKWLSSVKCTTISAPLDRMTWQHSAACRQPHPVPRAIIQPLACSHRGQCNNLVCILSERHDILQAHSTPLQGRRGAGRSARPQMPLGMSDANIDEKLQADPAAAITNGAPAQSQSSWEQLQADFEQVGICTDAGTAKHQGEKSGLQILQECMFQLVLCNGPNCKIILVQLLCGRGQCLLANCASGGELLSACCIIQRHSDQGACAACRSVNS